MLYPSLLLVVHVAFIFVHLFSCVCPVGARCGVSVLEHGTRLSLTMLIPLSLMIVKPDAGIVFQQYFVLRWCKSGRVSFSATCRPTITHLLSVRCARPLLARFG